MRHIRLLPQAIEDLDEIYEPLYSTVIAKIQLLKEYPSLGPAMDGPLSGYHVLIVGLFRVIYRIKDPTNIEIAYIRHVRRRTPF